MFNVILLSLIFLLSIIIFVKVYINEHERTILYKKMENNLIEKLEGKPKIYIFFYNVIFNLL